MKIKPRTDYQILIKNRMVKTIKILNVLIISIFIHSLSFSQTWVDNYITENLENTIVWDIAEYRGDLWFATDKGVYRSKGELFFHYDLSKNSSGNLSDYEADRISSLNIFTHLVSNEAVLVLSNNNNRNILKISDSTILNYEFKIDSIQSFEGITNLNVDKNSNIWISHSYFNPDTKLFVTDLYKENNSNNSGFEKYYLKNVQDSLYLVYFHIEDTKKLFVYKYNSNPKLTTILIFESDSLKFEKTVFINSITNEYLLFEGKFYVLTNYGILYTIENDSLIRKNILSEETIYNFNNSNFLIHSKKIYVPIENGLFVYDFVLNNNFVTKPKNFKKNCWFGFSKLFYHNGYLIALYGGIYKKGCSSNEYGLAFYKIY